MAEKAKEEGNKCMKEEKFVEAMMHYTEAVKIDPNIAAIYSNRSLAFLKMQQFYLALEDAKTAIKLEPKWPKGYYRMGEVQYQVELYKDALWSFKQALNFFPEDEKLQAAVQRAKTQYTIQGKAERRMPVYGVAAGIVLGLLIVIADQIATKNPVIEYVLLQGMLVVAISGICYAGTRAYIYFLRNQRKSLLEPPLDLFRDDSRPSSRSGEAASSPDGDSSGKPRKRVPTSAAKHKQRQAARS